MTPPKHYVLDSNVFVTARKYYFPTIFPSFWRELGNAGRADVVSSVLNVKREILRFEGEQQHLKDWMEENKNMFHAPNEIEQNKMQAIIDTYPNAKKHGNPEGKKPHWADPWIIARAQVHNAAVVTEEEPGGGSNNPMEIHKIPDICKALGVPCIHPRQFMEELKWRF